MISLLYEESFKTAHLCTIHKEVFPPRFLLLFLSIKQPYSFHTFKHYLLIARYYIYLARNKFEIPELEVFIVLLETEIHCEREIAITNGNVNKYRNK